MAQRPVVIYGIASVLSLAAFLVSYTPFAWLLIRYQTWRLGHANPFVFGPEINAWGCSLLAAVIVFWLAVKRQRVHRAGSSKALSGQVKSDS